MPVRPPGAGCGRFKGGFSVDLPATGAQSDHKVFSLLARTDITGSWRGSSWSLRSSYPKTMPNTRWPTSVANRDARLVIVGITPGPTQIEIAYKEAQARLRVGIDRDTLLARVKEAGAFGGPMRKNLQRMHDAHGIPKLLGIAGTGDLWGRSARLLHSTSVVPHAAFRRGKMFAGSFDVVMGSRPFRESFERDFAAGLPLLSPEARFIALGPTPLAALEWCAARGLVRPDRVLGAFAHPSPRGGSEVAVYLGEKTIGGLDPNDPVRHRTWLPIHARGMAASVGAWRAA